MWPISDITSAKSDPPCHSDAQSDIIQSWHDLVVAQENTANMLLPVKKQEMFVVQSNL
jgi:hypothetical protein